MAALAIDRPAIWTQDPRAADLIPQLRAQFVVYDLTDDWEAFEVDPVRRSLVGSRIRRLGSRADHVIACSRALRRSASEWRADVAFVPNAVDPPSAPRPVPADLEVIPRPRLGYVGTAHGSRLDIELLARVAVLRPDWSIVFLGPDHLDSSESARISYANVHRLGVRPHDEVRAYIEGLDVGLIPHRVNEFTRSLDPLKTYEYLAAGRPIVGTPGANTPDLSEYVIEAATAEDFVAAVDQAHTCNDATRIEARRAAVAAETWSARAIVLDELFAFGSPSTPIVDVSAVVVSFNTCDLLRRCLRALNQSTEVTMQIIVVDNGSVDGSVAMVRTEFPDVELVESGQNLGFGRANNLAFERCDGEQVLLINSDAFVEPNTVARLLATLRTHPRAGLAGPRLLNPDGSLQRSAWPFPSAPRLAAEAVLLHRALRRVGLIEDLGLWAHDQLRPVDFLIGACLLIRSDTLRQLGGFDEDFWMYGEEVDLQRRARTLGWLTVFVPDAVATHVGNASSADDSPARLRRFYSGQRLYLRKHSSAAAWPIARVALLVGSVLRRRWPIVRVALGLRSPS